MSRDKRGNRTQGVVGSIPISSTNPINNLARILATNHNCECLVSRLVHAVRLSIFQLVTRTFSSRIQEVAGSLF